MEPGFWDDSRAAQKVTREASGLREEIETWGDLERRADDLLAAVELLAEAPDAELEAELDRDAASLETDFRRERTALVFSGEYDDRNALLSISAGAGGTEATDWAEMLLRMYLRWAERHRFTTEILDQQEGRAGRSQERDRGGRRPARLRLASGRARRPSPRPDQPVRLAEPAPDHVRSRRGAAGGR